jgi:hypothetical protein
VIEGSKRRNGPIAGVYIHFGGRFVVPVKSVDLDLDWGVGRSDLN